MTDTDTRRRPDPGIDHAEIPTPTIPARPAGPVGRIVTLSMLGGLVAAALLVLVPFAGAEEHAITGSVLITFAAAWALLAWLSTSRTSQPQRWAAVPAAVMATAG